MSRCAVLNLFEDSSTQKACSDDSDIYSIEDPLPNKSEHSSFSTSYGETRTDDNCFESSSSGERDGFSSSISNDLSQEELTVYEGENGQFRQGVFIQHSSSLCSVEISACGTDMTDSYSSPTSVITTNRLFTCDERKKINKHRHQHHLSALSPRALERIRKMKSPLTRSQRTEYFERRVRNQEKLPSRVKYRQRECLSPSSYDVTLSQKGDEIYESRFTRSPKAYNHPSSEEKAHNIKALRRQRSDPSPRIFSECSIDVEETKSLSSRTPLPTTMTTTQTKITESKKIKKVQVYELVERLTRPTKGQLSQKFDLETKLKSLKLKQELKSKNNIKKKKRPTSTTNITCNMSQDNQEESKDDQSSSDHSANMASSLGILLSENVNELKKNRKSKHQTPVFDRYYGKLYASYAEKDKNQSYIPTKKIRHPHGAKEKKKVLVMEKMSNPVHLRLYNTSKNYQMEGKKRRSEIEEKERAKRELPITPGKISAEKASRLYYLGMESIKMKKKRLAQNSAE